jgi:hypothetical protein
MPSFDLVASSRNLFVSVIVLLLRQPRQCFLDRGPQRPLDAVWAVSALVAVMVAAGHFFLLVIVPLSARVDPIGSKRPARLHALYPRAVRFKARTHTRPLLDDGGLRQPICALLCRGVVTSLHRPGKSLAPRRSHGKRGPEHLRYSGTPAKPQPLYFQRVKSQAGPCKLAPIRVCLASKRFGPAKVSALPRRWLRAISHRRFLFYSQ